MHELSRTARTSTSTSPTPAASAGRCRGAPSPSAEAPRGPEGSTAVSDEQIRVLVAAARRMVGRQSGHVASDGPEAARARLEVLGWAVRAGAEALAERAAQDAASGQRHGAPG